MIFVIGGARSGKSSYSEKRMQELQKTPDDVLYIATAIPTDDDMKNRIERHKMDRNKEWHTIERFKDFDLLQQNEAFTKSNNILLDCLTIMITNIMFEHYEEYDSVTNEQIGLVEEEIKKEIEQLTKVCNEHNKNLLIVSNEVGFGLVPSYRLGIIFRDIAGRMNQFVASEADEVVLVTAGIPLRIK